MSSGSKKLEFNLKSLDSLGTGFGGASGFLRDSSSNPASPNGVKIPFANGLVLGIGEACAEPDGGPSRRVHVLGAKPAQLPPPCDVHPNSRRRFGLNTYSSADPSRYPNQGFARCNEYFQTTLGVFNEYMYPDRRATRASSRSGQPVSGFGVAAILDTNGNRNYDKGDAFSFVPLCGPYTHLDASGLSPTAPTDLVAQLQSMEMPRFLDRVRASVGPIKADPVDLSGGYNYIACGLSVLGGTYGGVLPSTIFDSLFEAKPPQALYLALAPSYVCATPASAGDLKIGVATPLTTTSTTAA